MKAKEVMQTEHANNETLKNKDEKIAELQNEMATALQHKNNQIDDLEKENAALREQNEKLCADNKKLTSKVKGWENWRTSKIESGALKP